MASAYLRGNNSSSMHRSNNSFGSKEQQAREANITLMELENNQKWDALGEQVSMLKDLSRDIHQEVRSQNALLDGMGKTFGATTDMFKSTIGKLGNMIQSGGSGHMFYLVFFILFVFLLLYYMMNRK